ncbi:MAG: chemotaxis protein CheW [bacterium]|nr:chemotaxis protein CheW [bacterium]
MVAPQSPAPRDSQTAPEVEIINFQLGEMVFGCDLGQASSFALYQEIQDQADLQISDLSQSLFSRPLPLLPETRMILLKRNRKIYAFPVSKISGIFKVPAEQIFSPPPILQEAILNPGLIGFALVNAQVVLLLDLEKTIAGSPPGITEAAS